MVSTELRRRLGDSVTLVGCGLAVIAFAASWWGTGRVRSFALANGVLDVPNERSLHKDPTPRGGGLAPVLVVIAGHLLLFAFGSIPLRIAVVIAGGGAVVALVGWIDDRRGLGPLWKAGVQACVGACAVALLGGVPSVRVGETVWHVGPAGSLLAVVGVVWLINLFNFMDGIDGLAASQATWVGAVGAVLLAASGAPGLAAGAVCVAAACGGFMLWNWPPARIFMGDVGSGTLGYYFAVVAMSSERLGATPLLCWIMVLGVFAFDATATLVRRVLRGDRWYTAHRTHAYQRLVLAGWTHASVAKGALVLSACLGLFAGGAQLWPSIMLPALVGSIAVLGVAYLAVEHLRPM